MNTMFRQPTDQKPHNPSTTVSDEVRLLQTSLSELASKMKEMTSDKLGAITNDVTQSAKDTTDKIEHIVRRNPTQATLVAAGVGFVVGMLLTRR
jgi:ElaB/YqjD/DUF883 family membrane-anchored ribosome-binding protein